MIQHSTSDFSDSMFYFSRYGGSKTQFLNLVLDEIQTKIPECIVLLFNDIDELRPENLYNKLKQVSYYKIPNIYNELEYINLMSKLESISSDINVDLRQSSNLNKMMEKLGFIKKQLQKNPELNKKLEEIIDLLRTSILVDSESVMKRILEIMKELTKNGLFFLFLYDELDLWIDETSEDLFFSKSFRQLEKVLKLLFESSQHEIKLFHLFACTDRISKLIEENKYFYDKTTSAGSRLMQIHGRAEIVYESGNYGDKIGEALAKISAFYTLSNDRFPIEEDFLNNTLEKLKQKYLIYSRKLINTKIINILKIYHNLKIPLEKGLDEWKRDVKRYSGLLHKYLDGILRGIEISFVLKEVRIEPDNPNSNRIDGYFINYDEEDNEVRTYAEIKLAKEFTNDKAYQVLQWSQVREKPIILIVFSPNSIDDIKNKIIEFSEKKGFSIDDVNRIHILNISIPFAFCSIIGIESLLSNYEELTNFYKDYGEWLDFYGDFSYKYQGIRTLLGFSYEKISKPRKEEEEKESEKKEKKELSLEAKMCMDILVGLQRDKKLNKTGRLAIATIEKLNNESSLGISNLEELYETMRNYDLIATIGKSYIQFSKDITKIKELDRFVEKCENKFKKEKDDLFSKFV